jgi:hypothetical protein
MDFYDVLDKVQDLLIQRGRVSYWALKIQFYLDDEALEALKEELIEVHHLAVDQDGRMLVWTGEARPTPVVPSPSSPHQAARHEDRPRWGRAAGAARPGRHAEYCGPPPGAGRTRYCRHQCGDAAAHPGVFYLLRSRIADAQRCGYAPRGLSGRARN